VLRGFLTAFGDENQRVLIDMRYERPQESTPPELPIVGAHPPRATVVLEGIFREFLGHGERPTSRGCWRSEDVHAPG